MSDQIEQAWKQALYFKAEAELKRRGELRRLSDIERLVNDHIIRSETKETFRKDFEIGENNV